MERLKLAVVQHKTTETDKEKNTAAAIRFIEEAAKNGADFVLFPECFLTSYTFPKICRTLLPAEQIENDTEFAAWRKNALSDDEECLDRIRHTAAEKNIGVCITGFTKGKKYPQNSAFIIGRTGEILLKYSKVHTCDFDVERYLEDGEDFFVCDFDGVKIGIMICYDREHPESSRELALQGAELIFVPNDCGGMAPRVKELYVRAMENMTGIAMANPPGKGAGNSCAFLPMVWDDEGEELDNTLVLADEYSDGMFYADFDIRKIREYRENEFLGKNRKPKAYKHLCR